MGLSALTHSADIIFSIKNTSAHCQFAFLIAATSVATMTESSESNLHLYEYHENFLNCRIDSSLPLTGKKFSKISCFRIS